MVSDPSTTRTLRALFRQDLILSLPTAVVGLLVIGSLGLQRRESPVDIVDAHADAATFVVLGPSDGRRLVPLLHSILTLKSLKLTNLDEIVLASQPAAGGVRRIIPVEGGRSSRVTLEAVREPLNLTQLQVPVGSQVQLLVADGIFTIQISPPPPMPASLAPAGQLSLPDRTTIMIERSTVLDAAGQVQHDVRERGQWRFEFHPSLEGRQVPFRGTAARFALELRLTAAVDSGGMFKRVAVRALRFVRPVREADDDYENTLRSATVRLSQTVTSPVALTAGYSFYATPDSFMLEPVVIDLKNNEFVVNAHSLLPVKSFRVGRSREDAQEQLPSVLAWLYTRNTLVIGIGLFLWLLGKAFALRAAYQERLAKAAAETAGNSRTRVPKVEVHDE